MRFHFVLVAPGVVSGIAGAALLTYSEATQYSWAYQLGGALLNECFVLFPVLGVAPFFIARLLDLPMAKLPESRAFPVRWMPQAAVARLIGIAIIASFWVDIYNPPRAAGWIRVAAIAFYVVTRLAFRGRPFLANSLRVAMMSVLAGFTVIALLPDVSQSSARSSHLVLESSSDVIRRLDNFCKEKANRCGALFSRPPHPSA